MKKPKCKACGGKVNSHNYCNACLTFAQPEAQAEQKVVDALFNQQIDKIKKTIYPISGFASSIPPEQKECWRCNLGEPKEFHVCEPNPSKCEHSHEPSSCKHCRPQPTDGLIDWGEKELESFFVAYSCYYSNSTPKTYEFNQKNKEKVKKQASYFIRQLLTEQKLKTKEDTIDEVLRALELNDDHEVPKIVIKALKSKKQ